VIQTLVEPTTAVLLMELRTCASVTEDLPAHIVKHLWCLTSVLQTHVRMVAHVHVWRMDSTAAVSKPSKEVHVTYQKVTGFILLCFYLKLERLKDYLLLYFSDGS